MILRNTVYFILFVGLVFLFSCKSTDSVKSITSNSLNEYEFDYLLEYNFQKKLDSRIEKRFILSNSKKSNYYLLVSELDSANYLLTLKDHEKLLSKFQLSKKDFKTIAEIELTCDQVVGYNNAFKYQTKNYDFRILKDTILDNKSYEYFKFESVKPKRKTKYKLGKNNYIVENNTGFHVPVFKHSTAYEEYKLKKGIPNGIYKCTYFESYDNKIESFYYLTDYYKSIRRIVIDKNCFIFK